MNNQDKLVELAFESFKDEIKPEHETYFKGVLQSELYKAVFNSLETYQKDILDKIDKVK